MNTPLPPIIGMLRSALSGVEQSVWDLEREVASLRADNDRLQRTINEQNETIRQLRTEVTA